MTRVDPPATPDGVLRIAPGFRLQWEQAQQSYVLLYPEGMIRLNDSAAEILKRCDGSRDAAALIGVLRNDFPEADLDDDVREFVQEAIARGWLHAE